MMGASTSTHAGDPAEVPGPFAVSGAAEVAFLYIGSPDVRALPLLDPVVLEELTEDLGAPDMSLKFVRDYAGLWSQRHTRLTNSVAQEDLDAALDPVISLKVTSAMVGGARLARLGHILETALRQGDLQQARALLALIDADGHDTVAELQRRHDLPSA